MRALITPPSHLLAATPLRRAWPRLIPLPRPNDMRRKAIEEQRYEALEHTDSVGALCGLALGWLAQLDEASPVCHSSFACAHWSTGLTMSVAPCHRPQ